MKSNLFIISGPSGSGQDSIIQGLAKHLAVERVITTTTRKIRPGESQKNPYYFISKKRFKQGIKKGEFLEYALEYNNNYYGVTKREIKRIRSLKKIGIWKIEYKGVQTAKKIFPSIIAILITAPLKDLKKRIKERDNATPQYLKERMEYTKKFLKNKHLYDYEVINHQNKLDQSIKKVLDIINKHK
ncbi:MAG: hypothetical protein ABIC19_00805 [Patescibacteria group bacterium]|nr:hypothetical protein [Patescibacteria group bacterium]